MAYDTIHKSSHFFPCCALSLFLIHNNDVSQAVDLCTPSICQENYNNALMPVGSITERTTWREGVSANILYYECWFVLQLKESCMQAENHAEACGSDGG